MKKKKKKTNNPKIVIPIPIVISLIGVFALVICTQYLLKGSFAELIIDDGGVGGGGSSGCWQSYDQYKNVYFSPNGGTGGQNYSCRILFECNTSTGNYSQFLAGCTPDTGAGSNKIKAPSAPTREGYVFTGWGSSSACTAGTYQPGTDVLISSSTNDNTFYACWQKTCNGNTVDSVTNECTALNREFNATTCGCGNCKDGYEEDNSGTCIKLLNCGTDNHKHFDVNTLRCECDNGWAMNELGTCSPAPTCDDNKYYSFNEGKCLCYDGYKTNSDGSCTLVKCGTNEYYNNKTESCSCKDGYSRNNEGDCVQYKCFYCYGVYTWDYKDLWSSGCDILGDYTNQSACEINNKKDNCEKGTYCAGNGTCRYCPADHYCPGVTSGCLTATSAIGIKACPNGSSTNGKVLRGSPLDCVTDTYKCYNCYDTYLWSNYDYSGSGCDVVKDYTSQSTCESDHSSPPTDTCYCNTCNNGAWESYELMVTSENHCNNAASACEGTNAVTSWGYKNNTNACPKNDDNFSITDYILDEESGIIYGIHVGTTGSTLISKIDTNSSLSVLDKDMNIIDNEHKICTGYTLRSVYENNANPQYDYKLSVRGDVLSVGELNTENGKLIAKHIIDKNAIVGKEYLLAADYDGDGEIKMNDVIKILKDMKQ